MKPLESCSNCGPMMTNDFKKGSFTTKVRY